MAQILMMPCVDGPAIGEWHPVDITRRPYVEIQSRQPMDVFSAPDPPHQINFRKWHYSAHRWYRWGDHLVWVLVLEKGFELPLCLRFLGMLCWGWPIPRDLAEWNMLADVHTDNGQPQLAQQCLWLGDRGDTHQWLARELQHYSSVSIFRKRS